MEDERWHPIETAPMDGTEIIVCFVNDYGYQTKPTVYGPYTAAYRRNKWMASWDGANVIETMSDWGTDFMEVDLEPTHWMPMPDVQKLK